MAFKARRQRRYNRLKQFHFLPFEAKALSRLQANNPFLKELIKARQNTFNQSVYQYDRADLRFSKIEWRRIVYATYEIENWFEQGKPGKRSPWAMYNYFEEKYKDKYPDWGEQYGKRKLRRQNFYPKLSGMKKAKAVRDAKKYPKGRYY